MTQLDVPPSSSGDGERHSRERIARPSTLDFLRRRVAEALAPKARRALVRRLLLPLVIALVPVWWVADATYRSSLTTVGRDQGIFQYIAWAVGQGDVDYRDIRDVNGPLVHMLHSIGLWLGGGDEHRFHVLDHWATGISFAFVGLLLPGIVKRPRSVLERLGWAFAAWVVLAGQYALYLYWNQAQRESFCDWFLLPSLALQIYAPRPTQKRIVVISALSTITWWCKPSFALFTVMQLGVLLFDRDVELPRMARIKSFVLGGIVGSILPIAYLLRYGDILAFLQITLRDVPQIYRFIWARSAPEILGDEGSVNTATMGLAATAIIVSLVATRALPRRMLAIGLAPVCGILVVVAQHKGFGYHFHPLTASMHVCALVVLVMLWERYRSAPRKQQLGRFVTIGLAVAYSLFVANTMRTSPHTKNVWILAGGETPAKRLEREYLDTFKTYDFYPWELREAAKYIAAHTSANARVQMYGMDPYLLFLAQRRSATPYIYAYDLNDDAALDGGWQNKPNWLEAQRISFARRDHERDLLARLEKAPPEVFVFVDASPLISYPDAWEDFRHCCTDTAKFVASHYHPAKSFDTVHVWMRDGMPVADEEGLPP